MKVKLIPLFTEEILRFRDAQSNPARKCQSCVLKPTPSHFKFLVLSAVSHNTQWFKHVLYAQKVFILGHGLFLLLNTDICLAFLWMPINH